MKVLIYEPAGGTHFFQHVSLIARACTSLGCDVVVTMSRDAETLPGYGEFVAPLADTPSVIVRHENPPMSSVHIKRTPAYRLKWLNEAIERHQPDHVLVTYGDGLMHEVGLRRMTGRKSFPSGVDCEVLLFKGRVAYPGGTDSLKAQAIDRTKFFFANAGRWAKKFHIDPFVCEMQRKQSVSDDRRFHVMPEPLEPASTRSKVEARRFLDIEESGRWIALPGGVDDRKGADLLLNAFAAAKLQPTDRLLLLGKASDEIRSMLKNRFANLVASGRIVLRDGFVSDEVLLSSFRAADVIAAPHRSCFQSSGIVTRGAVAGRPTVGTQLGWIGNMLRMFSLGRPCDTFDAVEFGEAIRQSFEAADAYVPGEGVRRLTEFHTIPNFQATWTDGIRAKLGVKPIGERRTWDWVMESARPSRS